VLRAGRPKQKTTRFAGGHDLFHDKIPNFGGIMPKFLGFDLNPIDFFEKSYTLCMEAKNQRLGFGRFP
jgi:hypothetical protein